MGEQRRNSKKEKKEATYKGNEVDLESKNNIDLGRRSFLKLIAVGGGSAALFALGTSRSAFGEIYTFFEPYNVDNPLAHYPNRKWEEIFRNMWEYDYEFTFVCAPNDTHECLLSAHVKNDVVIRIAPTMKYHLAEDLYGVKASQRWEPRCCQKGLALIRRFYGDRRVKYPVVRKGFLEWVKAGFPRDENGKPPAKYFEGRGKEPFLKISWEEAFEITAKALYNIAKTYSGPEGAEKLRKQGYDPLMIEAMGGSGTQVLKFRGGMPPLGAVRVFGMYRLANSMALLDAKIRGVPPEKAKGGRGWDNYSWHTDLPPGHPMVTGQQTVDWDLVCVDHADYIVVWGMNWITTKMPDAHWLTEARMKGATVTVIACEYSATCSKADKVLIVRPGTTPALALGFSYVIIKEKLYDEEYLIKYTDLPFLVRMDTLELLRARDLIPDYKPKKLKNYIRVLKKGEKAPPPTLQGEPIITEEMREEWDDFVVWDKDEKRPVVISRDEYGDNMDVDAALDGEFKVKLKDGSEVRVRTVFNLIKEYIMENFSPEQVSEITWAPKEGIIEIARDIAKNAGKTLFAVGMGPNQFFNNDLKDRAIFFLASLTKNIGKVGANVGSYAGNYRAAFFNGLPVYIAEDPFNPQTDEKGKVKVKRYFTPESAHYYNEGDKILRVGRKVLTGRTHMPTPTKSILVSNSNSLIGNAKWHYDTVMNVFPKIEFIGVLEWWWTASCEYADVVFPVDSWGEMKAPDATISVTNPFLCIFPRSPLPRIFNTKGDLEVIAGIAKALGDITGDKRFYDYFKFIHEGRQEVYLQRVFDNSTTTKGYDVLELEKKAKQGIPALMMSRTYPKFVGYDQMNEDKPWYTKTGRLEFYREEEEFRISGENLPVHREPIDSTFYEPNVIVAKPHEAIRPETPDKWGVSPDNLSTYVRQGRNVVKPWDEVKRTKHPLTQKDERYRFIFHTPKYRHGAHTTPVDTDVCAIWFGPFGDIYRRDRRMPFVTEFYVDINPLDAKELGIDDGDYVWIDADPEDRPFRGWQKFKRTDKYEVSRLLVRARYYPGTPRGVTRMWHNAYAATFGSVRGAKENPTGLAKNPITGYQALFRTGSHQSCTRGWIKPTHMTDSLVRKGLFGQKIGKGFVPDVHCPTGAPREAFVKIELAEKGGRGGKGLWHPIKLGIRPTYESREFADYVEGKLT